MPRETAIEERAAAPPATGNAPRALAELDVAVPAAPHWVRRWVPVIVGLYRCGRRARRAVEGLRLPGDELGINQRPELQRPELQRPERLVLAQDPCVLLPAPPRPPTRDNAAGALGLCCADRCRFCVVYMRPTLPTSS